MWKDKIYGTLSFWEILKLHRMSWIVLLNLKPINIFISQIVIVYMLKINFIRFKRKADYTLYNENKSETIQQETLCPFQRHNWIFVLSNIFIVEFSTSVSSDSVSRSTESEPQALPLYAEWFESPRCINPPFAITRSMCLLFLKTSSGRSVTREAVDAVQISSWWTLRSLTNLRAFSISCVEHRRISKRHSQRPQRRAVIEWISSRRTTLLYRVVWSWGSSRPTGSSMN